MARNFRQKMALALADPSRVMRSLHYRSRLLMRRVSGLGGRPERLDDRLMQGLGNPDAVPSPPPSTDPARIEHTRELVAQHPLMRDARTYNPTHPDFHPGLTRNYPGRIFGRRWTCDNTAYAALTRMARLAWGPHRRWRPGRAEGPGE